MTTSGHGVSFEDDGESILKLIVVIVILTVNILKAIELHVLDEYCGM